MLIRRRSGGKSWGTSRSVSRILFPACAGRRPSIWMHRCRAPRAVHPRARASSPRTPAQPHSRGVRPSTLLRAGFTEPPRSPGALVRSYRTVSPLPARCAPAVCFLWHCPAGHPGLPLTTALLCGVRTFLGAGRRHCRARSRRRGRPTDSSGGIMPYGVFDGPAGAALRTPRAAISGHDRGSSAADRNQNKYRISPWSVSRWGSLRETNSVQRGSTGPMDHPNRARW